MAGQADVVLRAAHIDAGGIQVDLFQSLQRRRVDPERLHSLDLAMPMALAFALSDLGGFAGDGLGLHDGTPDVKKLVIAVRPPGVYYKQSSKRDRQSQTVVTKVYIAKAEEPCFIT